MSNKNTAEDLQCIKFSTTFKHKHCGKKKTHTSCVQIKLQKKFQLSGK